MKKIFTVLFVTLISIISYSTDIASDDANNYSSWTNGSNQGTGFGVWNLYTSGGTGTAGHFLGDGAALGFGDIDFTSKDFGMYGNNGNLYANAIRNISPILAVGNTFSGKFAVAYRNGYKQISLLAGGVKWYLAIDNDRYDANGTVLGWSYSQTSIFLIEATQISSTKIYVRVTRGSDVYNSGELEIGGQLTGFSVSVGNTETGDLNNLFFNTLRIRDTDPVPVELISLSAFVNGNEVKLSWQTATEITNYGFDIERSQRSNVKGEIWTKIGFVNGHGNSNSPKNYTYSDNDVLNGNYSYRLKQIDTDGKYEYSPTVEVTIDNLLTQFELSQNYPNPFNPSTVISYALPRREFVQLKVFNVLGNEIATLVNEFQEAGNYKVEFSVSRINVSSSGVYFYRLEAGSFIVSRKMTLVK